MLHTPEEREIMRSAWIPTLRPDATFDPFPLACLKNILDDFTNPSCFDKKQILDVGPGQCDFLDSAKDLGAQTFGVDLCPAVVTLGTLRGHAMTAADFRDGWPFRGRKFDGILSRAAIASGQMGAIKNGAAGLAAFIEFLEDLAASLSPGGWLWVLPWNATTNEAVEAEVKGWAMRHDISIVPLTYGEARRYLSDFEAGRLALPQIWRRPLQVTGEQ